jgi:putative ATP-binding cassette transporter
VSAPGRSEIEMKILIKTKTKNNDIVDDITEDKTGDKNEIKEINFFTFLKKESRGPLYNIPVLAAVAGIANAILLAIINSAVRRSPGDEIDFPFMMMFFLAYAIYVLCQRRMLHKSNAMLEEIINNIRIRLSDKIRKADLLGLEDIGETRIYNRLTQETLIISDAIQILIMSLQSSVMLFFIAVYIAILSRVAFIIIVFLTLLAINFFVSNYKKMRVTLKKENIAEMNFFASLTDILRGTKEIRLDRKKSAALFSFIEKIAVKLKKIKIYIANKYVDNNLVPNTSYFLLIGVIIFILPGFSATYSEQLVQLTMAIIFMTGPLDSIVNAVQTFGKVNYAVSNIYGMETNLEKLIEIHEEDPQYDDSLKAVTSFKRITLRDIEFAYRDVKGNNGFSIGPISLEIQSGETLFIVGGNGSGKTTFLKVLCMLYYAERGSIHLDDIQVKPSNVVDYRQLFSGVFSDFHLFSRLYGMEGMKREKVEELLKIMQIEHKTKFLDDRFSTIDLSTGQRKRLALLISLLEDKPIYIFDEWAADQDPEFRQYFYEVILKQLKEQGKTVIAASHDDRFFHFADTVIKLDYGKVAQEIENGPMGKER